MRLSARGVGFLHRRLMSVKCLGSSFSCLLSLWTILCGPWIYSFSSFQTNHCCFLSSYTLFHGFASFWSFNSSLTSFWAGDYHIVVAGLNFGHKVSFVQERRMWPFFFLISPKIVQCSKWVPRFRVFGFCWHTSFNSPSFWGRSLPSVMEAHVMTTNVPDDSGWGE